MQSKNYPWFKNLLVGDNIQLSSYQTIILLQQRNDTIYLVERYGDGRIINSHSLIMVLKCYNVTMYHHFIHSFSSTECSIIHFSFLWIEWMEFRLQGQLMYMYINTYIHFIHVLIQSQHNAKCIIRAK